MEFVMQKVRVLFTMLNTRSQTMKLMERMVRAVIPAKTMILMIKAALIASIQVSMVNFAWEVGFFLFFFVCVQNIFVYSYQFIF